MSLLDQYGHPLYSEVFEPARLDYGARPTWPTRDRTFDQNISAMGISKIRSDCLRLFGNNGLIIAALNEKARYSVGRAFLPEFKGKDSEWGKQAKDWLVNTWYPIADVCGNDFQTSLFLESLAIDRDGDYFILLVDQGDGFPAQQLIPANKVGTRDYFNPKRDANNRLTDGEYKGLKFINGIVKNDSNRAVAFYVMGETPSDDKFVSARDMIHVGDPQWMHQSRFLPAITHGILDLRDAMTTKGFEVQAHQLASSVGLLEYNETGDEDIDDPRNRLRSNTTIDGLETVVTKRVDGGQTRIYKAGSGSKLEAFQFSRPGDGFERLMDRLERSSLTSVWPYELVWKPSELGGVNGRMVIARAKRFVQDRQDLLSVSAKRRVGYAIAKAIKKGDLPASDDWWRWGFTFPADVTADYGREAQSVREDYKLGFTNMHDVLASNGKDPAEHLQQREEELTQMIESAKRISDKTGVDLTTALSLMQQRSAAGNAPGGLQGTPSDPPAQP